MNAGDLLNADMATLSRWGRQGLGWWLGELAALVPARWRTPATATRAVLRFDDQARLLGPAPPPRSRPLLLLPDGVALARRVVLPDMPAEALWRTVDAEAARLLPLAPGALLLARREVARDRAAGTVEVEIAGLPRARGEAVAAELARLGVRPARIALGADAEGARFDFLPALRAAGLAPPASRQPAIAWAIVGFLFLLNVAVLVWRDQARVADLDALVASQRPAVALTQRLQRRIARFDALAAAASARRVSEPLALLARVGAALPPGAFLLRFEQTGAALRLSGYKPAGANIVAALRADPHFAEVRALRSDGVAELPGAQGFDITARVVR